MRLLPTRTRLVAFVVGVPVAVFADKLFGSAGFLVAVALVSIGAHVIDARHAGHRGRER